jgi:pyridoxamine 5'-phosphate oxidase
MPEQARDPIELFQEWFGEAHQCNLPEPDAMTLATASFDGHPSARVVLLRHVDERGFVFYTNLNSRKGQELLANPHAALCFHWMPLKKQVRVEGTAVMVSDEEADRYFASRLRGSQLSAWASRQSEKMHSDTEFAEKIAFFTQKFEGQPIPRPPHWSGFRIIPQRIEFWQEGEFRMHIRDIYEKTATGWDSGKYYP